ncbi:hypothetical protein EXIGLDRAFT_829314, partial [Exidia glandulosa HHB12029]
LDSYHHHEIPLTRRTGSGTRSGRRADELRKLYYQHANRVGDVGSQLDSSTDTYRDDVFLGIAVVQRANWRQCDHTNSRHRYPATKRWRDPYGQQQRQRQLAVEFYQQRGYTDVPYCRCDARRWPRWRYQRRAESRLGRCGHGPAGRLRGRCLADGRLQLHCPLVRRLRRPHRRLGVGKHAVRTLHVEYRTPRSITRFCSPPRRPLPIVP